MPNSSPTKITTEVRYALGSIAQFTQQLTGFADSVGTEICFACSVTFPGIGQYQSNRAQLQGPSLSDGLDTAIEAK